MLISGSLTNLSLCADKCYAGLELGHTSEDVKLSGGYSAVPQVNDTDIYGATYRALATGAGIAGSILCLNEDIWRVDTEVIVRLKPNGSWRQTAWEKIAMKTLWSCRGRCFALTVFIAFGCSLHEQPTNVIPEDIPLDGKGGGILTFNSDRDGNGEVYIMNADGSGQRNITNNPANDGFGTWSPDGMRVAFVSDRDGTFGVYVMNVLDLSNAEFATPVKVAGKRPSSRVSWSPDGSKLIFDAWPECELYIVDADGSNLTKLTNTPESEFQPQFCPDGEKIAFTNTAEGRQNICLMNLDGSDKAQLTNDGVSFFPTWSPDGKSLAFNSERPGRQDIDICVVDADGSNRRWLTDHYDHDEFPTWSPDGTKIAYQSSRGVHRIYIVNSDGSHNHPITSNTTYENGEPGWRPVH